MLETQRSPTDALAPRPVPTRTTLSLHLPGASRLACLLGLVLLPTQASAGVDRWTLSAPDGGAVTAIAVNPQDPGTLYAATETAGVFRSSDGGSSWQPARAGLPPGWSVRLLAGGGPDGRTLAAIAVPPFAIDETQPDQLFVSTDRGDQWVQRPLPLPTSGYDVDLNALVVVAVAPGPAPTLYLAINTGTGGMVFESQDRGLTWRGVQPAPSAPPQPSLNDLVIAPSAPDILYTVTSSGALLRSGDGGLQWTVAGHLPVGTTKLAVDPRDSDLLYAASLRALARSADGGHTWSRPREVTTQAIFPSEVVAVAVDPVHRDTLYYAVRHFVAEFGDFHSDYIEDRFEGLLFRSTDGGRSWTLVLVTQVLNALAVVESPAGRGGTRVYTGASRDGILRSDDGGSSWRPAASGLTAAANCSLAADPFLPQLLYVSSGSCVDEDSDMGFLRGGPAQAWTAVSRGLRERARVLDAFGIVPDPRLPGTLYALTGQGLFESDDRGDRWRPLRRLASDQEAVTALAIDPSDSDRLYAVGYAIPGCGESQCGLAYFARKSTDAGETWSDFLLSETYLTAVSVDPHNPEVLYMIGGFPGASYSSQSHLLKSTDRGKTWRELSILNGAIPVTQLLIHPQDSRLLVAALYSTYYQQPKIAKSTDGGESWVGVDGGLPLSPAGTVNGIALDPLRPSTMYAATDQGLFVTDDGGSQWSPLSKGLEGQGVWRILVDPFDPLTLYAGTHASGGLFALTRSQAP